METIRPAKKISGKLSVPGDKSISHRALMLAAIADGVSVIEGLSTAEDVQSTANCLRALGIEIEHDGFATVVHGKGLRGLQPPVTPLDAGNSGTTMRLLSGILAGQPFETMIDGDDSLRRRPMTRIIRPLQQMGAEIVAAEGGRAPLTIRAGQLQPLHYEMPVASAQVKSAILLAGLYASGKSSVVQPVATRDHTERMLRHLGARLETKQNKITIAPGALKAGKIVVPGDFSSAIFFMAAAFMLPGSALNIFNVGVNATRSYALKILQRAGAEIVLDNLAVHNGEEVADFTLRSSKLSAFRIGGKEIPLLIDEIPILAVLATQAKGISTVRNAAELRVKESDRIRAIAENLAKMGVKMKVFEDGFEINGPVKLHGAEIDSFGDHRIAMAFAIAGLIAEGETGIHGTEAAAVSFPGFFEKLAELSA
ncbi:MAG: 3-phosphoshikimate 1-carboxyvinyltransferase [bacterium]